jgi:galactose mutarotase-like enzyme
MTVKGEDVIRRTWASIDDIRGRMGLNGIPLLWPYANRLDEQGFYANGQKYTFDPGIGNTGRGAIPMHGFLTGATAWKVIEAKADAKSAWVTSKLEFFRIPQYPQFSADWSKLLTDYGALVDGSFHFPSAQELANTDVMVMYKGDAGSRAR